MIDTKLLRQKILDLAIRGKLVPQDKSEEPASVLLERIRNEKAALVKQGKIKKTKQESFIYKNPSDNRHYENVGGKVTDIEDQIPFRIPDTWAWARTITCLNEQKKQLPQGDYFDYIDIDAIDNKLHRINKPKHLQVNCAPSRASKGVQCGDVLFSLVRPYLENIALISSEFSHCIASTGFYVLKPNKQLLLPQYVFLFFTSKFAIDGLTSFMKGDNSPSIRKENMDTFLIPLPPLNEQRRIINHFNVLQSYMDIINENQIELSNLATLAKSEILDLAMRGKLVPQDPNDEPASELLKRISTSHKPHYENIPKNWTECQIEDVLSYEQPQKYIVESIDYNDAFKTPVLTAGKSFILGYTNEKKGIFTNLPCIIFDDFTAESKYVDFQFKIKSSAMKLLIANKFVDTRFIWFLMQTIKMDTSTHKRYWISDFSKRFVLIPPFAEQIRIVKAIKEVFILLDTLFA